MDKALGGAKKVKNLGDKAWGSAQRAFKNRNSDSGGDSVSR